MSPEFLRLKIQNMQKQVLTDAMVLNTDHLSDLGAIKLTHRVDSLLRTLKQEILQNFYKHCTKVHVRMYILCV